MSVPITRTRTKNRRRRARIAYEHIAQLHPTHRPPRIHALLWRRSRSVHRHRPLSTHFGPAQQRHQLPRALTEQLFEAGAGVSVEPFVAPQLTTMRMSRGRQVFREMGEVVGCMSG